MASRRIDVVARMNMPSANPSRRFYVHRSGLKFFEGYEPKGKKLFLRDSDKINDPLVEKALMHCVDVGSDTYEVDHNTWGRSEDRGKYRFPFIVGMAWGDNGDLMIDGIGFRGLPSHSSGGWPGNPNIYSWIFKNGVLVSEPSQGVNEVTCGDGLLIAAGEERCRRKASDLNDFVGRFPDIEGMNLEHDVMHI